MHIFWVPLPSLNTHCPHIQLSQALTPLSSPQLYSTSSCPYSLNEWWCGDLATHYYHFFSLWPHEWPIPSFQISAKTQGSVFQLVKSEQVLAGVRSLNMHHVFWCMAAKCDSCIPHSHPNSIPIQNYFCTWVIPQVQRQRLLPVLCTVALG